MIDPKEALAIHQVLIEQFGGSLGIRDYDGLAAALSRPYSTFDQQDLYPDISDKAAALLESIVKNHPFVDGNKRIGYVLMRLLLLHDGYDINANQDEKYEFVIAISKGELDIDQIKDWIRTRIVNES